MDTFQITSSASCCNVFVYRGQYSKNYIVSHNDSGFTIRDKMTNIVYCEFTDICGDKNVKLDTDIKDAIYNRYPNIPKKFNITKY